MNALRFEPLARRLANHVTALVLGVAAVGAAVGFAVGDDAGGLDPSKQLRDFFGASAQVMAALLIALALFQSGPSPAAGHGARRFLSLAVFPLLGLGLVSAIVGLTHSLPACAYRLAFSVVTGAGTAALVTTLMVGAGNIQAQRDQGLEDRADELDPG